MIDFLSGFFVTLGILAFISIFVFAFFATRMRR